MVKIRAANNITVTVMWMVWPHNAEAGAGNVSAEANRSNVYKVSEGHNDSKPMCSAAVIEWSEGESDEHTEEYVWQGKRAGVSDAMLVRSEDWEMGNDEAAGQGEYEDKEPPASGTSYHVYSSPSSRWPAL